MASRLNHLFQIAPGAFLERIVLFMDGLNTPAATTRMRDKITHFIDLESAGRNARARVLAGHHLYQDAPMLSYFVPPTGFTLIPREDPPHQLVFLPEFTRCRLLISADGTDWLRLQLEENLNSKVPPPDSKYLDSFAYWDQTGNDLIGVVRATAILVKQAGQPWTIIMQQIVGNAGHEVVRQTFTHKVNTPQ